MQKMCESTHEKSVQFLLEAVPEHQTSNDDNDNDDAYISLFSRHVLNLFQTS